jgi:hypothetical protein
VAGGDKWATCVVVAAELSVGGGAGSDLNEGDAAAAAATGGPDPKVDDPSGTEGACDGAGGRMTIPGGGDATASGSSISSSGKSGNCSSKGEAGTFAKPLGITGLTGASVAEGTVTDETGGAAFATVGTLIGLVGFVVPFTAASFDEAAVEGALRDPAPALPGTFEGLALRIATPTGLVVSTKDDAALLGTV